MKAIILYSDPDQYSPFGTSYPDSWYLPEDGVQRGTVLRIRGDPLSNGYPALGKLSVFIARNDVLWPRSLRKKGLLVVVDIVHMTMAKAF